MASPLESQGAALPPKAAADPPGGAAGAYVDSDDDAEDAALRQRPSPVVLKERGNAAFAAGNTADAIALWQAGLKETLKMGCVPPPQRAAAPAGLNLHDLCTTFRLNLAQGFMKQKEYISALDQLDVALSVDPENVKGLFRRAECHFALAEWDKCDAALAAAQRVDPVSPALKQMALRVDRERGSHERRQEKLFAKMFPAAAADADDPPRHSAPPPAEPVGELCTAVGWEHLRNGAASDAATDELWTKPHTTATLKDERRALILSLPFTVLDAIDNGARLEGPAALPFLDILNLRRFVIHLVGVRGDVEMECMWTSILERLPRALMLQIICVGFLDDTDFWGAKLTRGELTPPMGKWVEPEDFPAGPPPATPPVGDGRKRLTCRLYKGRYQEFLDAHGTCMSEPSDPLYPHLVVIAEPALDRHFDDWTPALARIIKADKVTLVTGSSAVDVLSHDGLNLPPVLAALGGRVVIEQRRNPFAVKIQPDPETPPMPIFRGYGQQPLLYSGASAKNAVYCVVKGTEGQSPAGRLEAIAAADLNAISQLKSELRGTDVDVDISEMANKDVQKKLDEVMVKFSAEQAATQRKIEMVDD